MADIALAIFNRLSTDTSVSALIGNRVYPDYDRQSDHTYPLVVYTIDVSPQATFDGTAGIEYAVARLACVASSYAQVTALADAVESSLENQSGTWGGVIVQGFFAQQDGVGDDVVTDPTTEAILYYVKSMSFDVAYGG